MIRDAFNSLISQNSVLIENMKTEVKNSVEAEFKAKIQQELSDPENIKKLFEAQNITTPEDLKSVERIKNNLMGRAKFTLQKVDAKIKQLKAIQSKSDQVTTNLDKLSPRKEGPVKVAADFLPLVELIITVASASLGFFTGLLSNAKVEKEIGDKIDLAKSKVKEFRNVISAITNVKKYMDKELAPINNKVTQAILILEALKLQVEEYLRIIEEQYLLFIAPYLDLLIDEESQPIGETGIPEELVNSINTENISSINIENIIQNLPSTARETFIRRIRNSSKPLETGYKIIKK